MDRLAPLLAAVLAAALLLGLVSAGKEAPLKEAKASCGESLCHVSIF